MTSFDNSAASLAGEPPAPVLTATMAAVRPSFHRILVVEDNLDAQEMLCELLIALGHDAHGVSDAEAALLAVAAGSFDILLTDLTLPGMSGLELARKVVVIAPDLNIIFSSGYGAVTASQFPFKSASLPKPYDVDTLQKVLASVSA